MTSDVRRRFHTHECCLKGLRRSAVGHGIDEAAPRRVGEVEHVREELAPNGKAEETKTAIALKEQKGSRAPAAGQPPEQTSVGSGAEGSCQAPDVLARAGGWFKPARIKLASGSNSAVDSLGMPSKQAS